MNLMVMYWVKNAITIVGVDKTFHKETHRNLSINISKFCSVNAGYVGKHSQQFTITNYKPFLVFF
jgi:hypothetical protein